MHYDVTRQSRVILLGNFKSHLGHHFSRTFQKLGTKMFCFVSACMTTSCRFWSDSWKRTFEITRLGITDFSSLRIRFVQFCRNYLTEKLHQHFIVSDALNYGLKFVASHQFWSKLLDRKSLTRVSLRLIDIIKS